LLALRGEVTREQFEAIREGLQPETGEFLRPRHSADRTTNEGNEQSKARSLYDLTFSAPKSVSVQALVGGDDRLVAAHDEAVREALGDIELGLYFFRFRLGAGPGGWDSKVSTSERLRNFLPPTVKVVNRPLFTSSAIAWRLTPRNCAA
jgi:hypothetical protein